MTRFHARTLRSLFACGVLVASIGACDSPPTPAPTSFVNLDSLVKAANGDPGVWPRVATALIHGDSMAAVHAAELLAHAGPAALPAIRRLLRELDPRSQRLGAYALGSLGPAGAPALRDLIPLLGGADSTVASMADWSLSRIAPAREPPLLSLARDLRYGDDGVRLDAALNLKQVTDDVEPVCPLLVQRLADPSPAVRGAAFAVLEKAGATVLRCLQQPRPDADPEIRAAVRLLRIRVEGGGLGN